MIEDINEEFWTQRNPWYLFTGVLLGIFYFVGAVGGVWYICSRIFD